MEVNGDVSVIEGEKLLIEVEEVTDSGTFVHSCLINTNRKIAFKSNLTETEVANCLTPSAPAKIIRKVKSIDFDPSGAGKTDKGSVWFFIQWWQSGEAKAAKIVQNETGANGGWTGTGELVLESFETGGDRGDYQEAQVAFKPAAPFVWEQNA